MITARLRPSPPAPELLLECHHRLQTEARVERAALLKQARKRARGYARHARLVGHKAGLADGAQESRKIFERVLEKLEKTYHEVADRARHDAFIQASLIAETLVGDYVTLNPEIMKGWLDGALEHFSSSAALVLCYHPQHEAVMTLLKGSLPTGIKIQMDPSLTHTDFSLQSDLGSIECSWREVLRAHLKPEDTKE